MKPSNLTRLLQLPERSFFLFGPRGVGKSTWLRAELPNAYYMDLLNSALFLELSQKPHVIESLVGPQPDSAWIVVDEIQKIPGLLDEVHRLMELRKWRFALCGSSARKLRRGGVNLLAGRAVTRNMEGFCFPELGELYDLEFYLDWGGLPLVQLDKKNAPDILSAYVNTYIKEEIREEGIVRNLQPFLRFIGIAGMLNGQIVNGQNIAREASVSRSNVDVYFSILEDTLLGHFLPAYRPNLKVREQAHPKFYWFDAGVARAAAGLVFDPVDRFWGGTALETLVYHELRVFSHTANKHRPIYYYRTSHGSEIDFIIETQKLSQSSAAKIICIEVKLSEKWDRKWEKPMRSLYKNEKITVERMLGLYTGSRSYNFNGVEVWPITDFLQRLHDGEIF